MQTILNIVVPIFGLIALGYLAARIRLLSDEVGDGLTGFVFTIAVPALLLRTLASADFGGASPFALWISYFGGVAITWMAGTLLIGRMAGTNRRKSVIGGISASFANTVFVAIPMLQRAYGDEGLQPLLIIISIHLPIMMIASTLLMERAATLDARDSGATVPVLSVGDTMRRLLRNLATNGIVVGILLGLAWRLTGQRLESHLDQIVQLLGATASPLALFSLGMSLTRYGIKGDLGSAVIVSALSLLIMPTLVFIFAQLLGLQHSWLRGAVLTAASPAGVNVYLLANYFRAGQKLAATATLVTTILSIATLSLWLSVLS